MLCAGDLPWVHYTTQMLHEPTHRCGVRPWDTGYKVAETTESVVISYPLQGKAAMWHVHIPVMPRDHFSARSLLGPEHDHWAGIPEPWFQLHLSGCDSQFELMLIGFQNTG